MSETLTRKDTLSPKEWFKKTELPRLESGTTISLPASASKPPQESLRDYFPDYIALAKDNDIKTINVNIGQLTFTYNVDGGSVSNFDVDDFSKQAGVNVDLMKQKTEKVLQDLS